MNLRSLQRVVRATAAVFAFGALLASPALAQEGAVTGTVTRVSNGQPLEGAQVLVVGTNLGTIAGADGSFRVTGVPVGEQQVQVQLVGYASETSTVQVRSGQSATVDFQLSQSAVQLEEIVVSGRATGVAQRNLANAISTLNTDELVQEVSAETVEEAMQGKIAGASVKRTSGAPGGGMAVELRGVTSIVGRSQPLYVVDGVIVSNNSLPSGQWSLVNAASETGQEDNAPNRISDLNPNDIASVEILKGPSAAAIYGSKASNGVVVIETKSGQFGGGAGLWNVRQSFSVPDMSNKIGLRKFESEQAAVDAFGPTASEYWAPDKFFDHEQELAGGNPLSYETSVSVRGGTENTSFYLSGLNKDEGGIVRNTGYEKQSLRLNLDQQIGSLLQLSVNTNYVRSDTRRGLTNNDNRSISYWMAMPGHPSFIDLRQKSDGTFPVNPFTRSNVLQTSEFLDKSELVNRFIGSAQLRATPVSTEDQSLRLTAEAGFDWFDHTGKTFSPPFLQYEQTLGEPGTSIDADGRSQFANLSLSGVYVRETGNVELTTSVGGQYERRDVDRVQTIANNLIAGLQNVDRGTNLQLFEDRLQVEDVGFFVQEEVLIDERLMLTAGVRGDQSSNNVDTEKIFWYPKASASYRFVDMPGFVQEVKLRSAFGQSGNQPQYGQKFTLLSGSNYGGLQSLRISGSTSADDLQPERQSEIEAGVDVTFEGDRGQLSATVYQQNISNLLVRRNLPESTGLDVLFFNGGEIRHRGVETELSVLPVQSSDISWNSRVTFSLNRGEVTDLPVPPFEPPAQFGGLGSFLIEEGESPTTWVGNDTTSDGSIETNQRLGRSRPSFSVGFGNDVQLGDFSVSALWDWRQGFKVANLTGWLFDLSKNRYDYADPCTMATCQEGETLGEYRNRLYPSRVTGIWLEDASFVKLRELSLGWEIPSSITSAVWSQIGSASIRLAGRNLLRFTDYSGMDPEVSNWGNQSVSTGQDVAPYPPSRIFQLTLDLSF